MTTPSEAEYPLQAVHRDGCGGVTFFLKRRPASGERIISDGMVYPDGGHPEPGDLISCQACGKFLTYMKTEWIEDRKPTMAPTRFGGVLK